MAGRLPVLHFFDGFRTSHEITKVELARDVARSHGGDVTLGKSELGGLRATIRLPLDTERPKGLGDEED